MNLSLRNSYKRYQIDFGCDYSYGRYIKEGMRAGLLDPNRVALCAYLYHKPSELALDEYNKGTNFLWFDRILNRCEPLPLILDLRRWGSRVTIMAACGAISKINEQIPMTGSYFNSPTGLLEAILNYAKVEDVIGSLIAMNSLRTWQLTPLEARGGFNTITERYLYELRSKIISDRALLRQIAVPKNTHRNFPGLDVLVRMNISMDDDVLIDSMRSKIVPWALEGFI